MDLTRAARAWKLSLGEAPMQRTSQTHRRSRHRPSRRARTLLAWIALAGIGASAPASLGVRAGPGVGSPLFLPALHAAETGTTVTAIGIVQVSRVGDAVQGITIVGKDRSYAVRLDQNARRLARLEGKRVQVRGVLKNNQLTVQSIHELK